MSHHNQPFIIFEGDKKWRPGSEPRASNCVTRHSGTAPGPGPADDPSPCVRPRLRLPPPCLCSHLSPAFLSSPPWSCSHLQVTLPLEPRVFIPGETCVFAVDRLLRQVTVRMHGDISSFWIKNPAGAIMWARGRHKSQERRTRGPQRERNRFT